MTADQFLGLSNIRKEFHSEVLSFVNYAQTLVVFTSDIPFCEGAAVVSIPLSN